MSDVAFLSAKKLAGLIRRKKISSLELLNHYLDRIERHNPKINAVIAMDIPSARRRARLADKALAKGEVWGPLHGVPMTFKESYDITGLPTTWGNPDWKDNIATKNALSVDRMQNAGVVVFGKTNVPLMLADWQSYNDIYGITNNPWDVRLSPGGSSGGSAAALAAGFTGIEAGSDIGASIRNPAHYCGVYGHKPTWNLLPSRGHAPPGVVSQGDISVIGPLARSADDLAIALDAMAGPDAIEAAGYKLALKAPKQKQLRDFKIAVMLDDKMSTVDSGVKDRIQELADFLGKKRVKVDMKARPDIDTRKLHEVYVALLRSATSGRMAPEVLARSERIAHEAPASDQSYLAQMSRANVMPHRLWLGVNEQRHKMRLKWAEFFEDYDVLLCPAAASAACPHDHVGERFDRTIEVNGKQVPTTDQLFWAGYSCVTYLPGTVAPIGFTKEGLPVGVQIVGPQFSDRTTIAFAQMLEREYQDFVAPTGYD
ncbi:glutamyl-tRNA(Gln) amidotransferase subunit A [Variibacter gotjawalensis]|uniref:Glutamyl-tRNA(Gln) amidotransferase subunit A n=1 Tax=Variibacter gotjawalensis TaxID=1333996 RepID=A0A0S3PNW5_9BRAD|nr:amidase [Variibacter gotjawalensis]NIK47919.1 amidase [Variibacter gotjawalensis]RZS49797.1 amidase [Variibacter gotjawalensis]BAT57626.1 glutamyl-tRNA(Gln) amidotransferase subunit A [Variibacter gotjawalensis]